MKNFDRKFLYRLLNDERFAIFYEDIASILRYEDPFSRTNKMGHVTASGLVICESKALLIFHPNIKKWLQPGGHIDDGELPIEAAIREVYEETGVVCRPGSNAGRLIDIDVHEIPANPIKSEGCHLHIDLLFELQLSRQEKAPEDIFCRWFAIDQIENSRIRRVVAKLSP